VAEHRWLRTAHPLVDGRLADVPERDGVGAVAQLLADVRPDLVVTFGPDGLTGHSDHRTISRWVTRAWERTGESAALWYAALTPDFLDRWGGLCDEHSVWMDGGPPEPVDPRDLVHVQVCAGPLLERKYAALAAHTSQTADLIARVGEQRYREWWSTEAFVAAPAAALEQAA
jgi:LmbE family N-acetylglucosaminyl deacetylase